MNQIQFLQRYRWLPEDVSKSLKKSIRTYQNRDLDLSLKIRQTAKTYLKQKIDRHLIKKLANKTWLWNCINKDHKAFPYRISGSGKGKILNNVFYYPTLKNTTNPSHILNTTRFIVNIPEGRAPSHSPKDSKYSSILKLLKTESFSSTSSDSSRMFKSRVAVVVGTNQIESLDPDLNKAFIKLIRRTPRFLDLSCRRFGFFWRPEYSCRDSNESLYSAKKAFLLLKVLSKINAVQVQKLVESPNNKLHPNILGQIPFKNIRQTILKSNLTRNFANIFQQRAPASPVYLTVMDADFLSLRRDNELGIFSKAMQVSGLENPLSVIGAGYSVALDELPIIKLAVQIDMAVRLTMTTILPYSAYLPEPFLCVLLQKPNQDNHLSKLSFLGNGKALESRYLIKNGKAKGVFDDHMAFMLNGITTSSPDRWKTKKNCSYITLTKTDIKRKRVLQAIRGLSQSHTHPKKWADQIYSAIDFSCSRVTDATTPMMYIFHIFDPISRMFGSPGRFTSRTFNNEISGYNNDLTDGQKNLLNTSRAKLITLGVSKELVDKIVLTAKASGETIYKELYKVT